MASSPETTATCERDEPGSCPASPDDETEQPPERTGGPCAVDVAPEHAEIDTAWVRDRLAAALALLTQVGTNAFARVSVRLVDDSAMSTLHARHADDPTTTDVLTFPASAPGAPIEVDIAVCEDEAARQAARHGHPIAHEVLLYALHGVLHVCGHDDHTDDGFRAMHAEEDRLLGAIGVGATFRSGPDGAREW